LVGSRGKEVDMDKTAVFVIGKAKSGRRDELRKLYMEHIRPRAEAEKKQEMAVYCYSDDDQDTMCLFELFQIRQLPKRIWGLNGSRPIWRRYVP
jgi:hypothetical protein